MVEYKFNIPNVNYDKLNQEIIDLNIASPVFKGLSTCKDPGKTIKLIYDGELSEDSPDDLATVTTAVNAHDPDCLAMCKEQLKEEVDRFGYNKYKEILTFTYDSKEFSLSPNAQQKISHYNANKASNTYPVKLYDKTNANSTLIADEAGMGVFHSTMVGAFVTEMDLIQLTKKNIDDAVDLEAAQAAADEYFNL